MRVFCCVRDALEDTGANQPPYAAVDFARPVPSGEKVDIAAMLRLAWILTLLLASPAAWAMDKKIKSGEGLVFGYVTLHAPVGGAGYRLYLREVTTGKRVALPLDGVRAGGQDYRFAQSIKPGRYFFETAMAPHVEWENVITDKSKFFDVAEDTAVYLGKWTLLLTPKQTRYDIAYPGHVARSILEKIKGVTPAQIRKGVLGGPNEPFDPHSTEIPGVKKQPEKTRD
jgi:hypothetical protein